MQLGEITFTRTTPYGVASSLEARSDIVSMTMTAAIAPADGGGTLARGVRTTTQIHCRKFLSTFCRGADEDKTVPPFTARLRTRKPRC